MRDGFLLHSLPPARRRLSRTGREIRRIVPTVVPAVFVNPGTGERVTRPYLMLVDQSRYPPDRLREIQRDGKHR